MKCYKGSCHCGNIKFEVKDKIKYICHCHCVECQKMHASAFATWVGFCTTNFKIDDPKNSMKLFKQEHATRGFCSNCGSNLYFYYHDTSYSYAEENEIAFARACFDTGIEEKPTQHIFYDCKKDWYEISDDLPKCKDENI